MTAPKVLMRVGDLTPREAAEAFQQLLDCLGFAILVAPTHEPTLGLPRELELLPIPGPRAKP